MNKKVTEEQLDSLRTLQGNLELLIKRYGELHFQKRLVEEEISAIEADMQTWQLTRQEMVTKLQTEFGSTGTIDLSTGEFVSD